ncbi:MAG: xanthine dehydrogenase molybdopterin binding subunit [Terrimicrobiaceae bacterium]|nr:xanthine dehydrogenase molybdopterin binding subunit [Terrimicrobiaceae bacterium]
MPSISLRLNGEPVTICGVHPNTTLLNWLRGRGLTAAKEGCAEGDCGACTVVVVERDADGRRVFRSINSCIALLPSLAGRDVWTVEGIGAKGLHPVQRAVVDCYGSQCGYCTPGFIASLFEGYYREDVRSLDDLNDHLCGNLCRCTGYRPIRQAAAQAWQSTPPDQKRADEFGRMLEGEGTHLEPVGYETPGTIFLRPTSLPELFEAMAQNPGARLLAGGTEIGVEVAKMFREFPVLIHLQGIPELQEIRVDEDWIEIGANLPLTDVLDRVPLPSLREMLRWFASRPVRNRATLGGNLVTASPIGDTAPVLLSLDARIVLESAAGSREIPLEQFFTGYRRTVLEPGEIVRCVRVPRAIPGARRIARAFKVSKRREMDISIVSAGICVDLDAVDNVVAARLAFGGVAPTPVLARNTAAFLAGRPWSAERVATAQAILIDEFAPITDGRGSAEFRRALTAELLAKAFAEPEPEQSTAVIDGFGEGSTVEAHRHESAVRHVTGSAEYVDDEAIKRGTLVVWPVCSPHAHARIVRVDVAAARSLPGVAAVLTASDVPGVNDIGCSRLDEILLADKEVQYIGHPVVAIVAETPEAARAAAAAVVIDYEPLPAVVTIDQAIQDDSFHTEASVIRRGDAASALAAAPHVLDGTFAFGGQEHFYLETQAAWAERSEDDGMLVHSSTQHPSEIQLIVARVLDRPRHQIVVRSPRMGGGFGGKETQGAGAAALAALAAHVTGRPCRARFNRDQDFEITGKRHPFLARFRVGYSDEGDLLAASVELFANGGWSLDLSLPICDRALFHLDNAYFIPAVDFRGRVCKTNLTSQTAFRGFGGPQGMLVIEEILDRIARRLGRRPEDIRERNLYRGTGETNTTHYGQDIGDQRIRRIWSELRASSQLDARREELAAFNRESKTRRRGIAMTPVKFGISFTYTPYNQAGALVLIYGDGTVQVNHGGTEMGQGLHTKILGVAEKELGLPAARIKIMQTRTDKVPNTSATAASSGADLNGAAVRNACETLRARLAPLAAEMLSNRGDSHASDDRVRFENGSVTCDGRVTVSFNELVAEAYLRRISLSATGYYRTPEIHYDRAKGRGRPFYYFACGAAVTEVEIDVFTGQSRVRRVDILHDVGNSLNEGIDRGQIEGGFIQGMGWLTGEELLWNEHGRLLSHGASTYQIPSIGDTPPEFRIQFLADAAQPGTIHNSKAVGEPPLMLAISVREALKDALATFHPPHSEIPLRSPATCEAIFRASRRT